MAALCTPSRGILPCVRIAAIDVGSNSVLLTVMERRDAAWNAVREDSHVTALGEGLRETGTLTEPAMARTLEAIQLCQKLASELGAREVRAAVTMAGRMATNVLEFLARAERQGTRVRVLSGDDEARLGFLAVADDPPFASEPALSVIDVGGHSTELVSAKRSGSDWSERFRRSYAIGTLGLMGNSLGAECPTPAMLMQATSQIDNEIGLAYGPGECGRAVVLGATGTNLVAIRDKVFPWSAEAVHGKTLTYEEISRAVAWLSAMTIESRSNLVGMEPGRERTLHIGCLILEIGRAHV